MRGFDDYLTTAQAAEVMNVTKTTLESWRWSGKGPAYVRLGKVVRYGRAAIQEFIEANVYTSIESRMSAGNLGVRPAFREVGFTKETADQRKARLTGQRELVARIGRDIRLKGELSSKRKTGNHDGAS
ncbi:excisionase family DNA binding protein [Granulicella aggregans]|uniref:Excisionase family DNA binding protein n=1 Tax=Granulicella aggregans TaxID=474949 RepID=A0A7W7ZCW8_9BACT|nr:excisionase family DNA binding protein [Granulicella aggregans]